LANLFGWGARREPVPVAQTPARPADSLNTSVVLPKFLAALGARAAPTILDLGPVVGANVSFFGERLGCKLLIGDFHRDIDSHGRDAAALQERLIARLTSTVPAGLDGVLCWDVFDFLPKPIAHAVGGFLTGRLLPGGVIHGFFGSTPAELTHYTKFIVQSPTSLESRSEPAPATKRTVLQTRDLTTMFPGLKIVESVLLKSQRRETLMRK